MKARVQGEAAGLPLPPDGAKARRRVRGEASGLAGEPGPPFAGCALWALQVHPAPFWGSPRGNRGEAFQEFLELPVPRTPGVTLSSIPPPPTAAGQRGCRAGAAGQAQTPGSKRRPGAPSWAWSAWRSGSRADLGGSSG